MATSKRKRLEKALPAPTPPADVARFFCSMCGDAYPSRKGKFPVSHGKIYAKAGFLPICNKCIDSLYDNYCKELGPKEAMRRICMKFDIYWNESVYDIVERTAENKSWVRTYISKTNMYRYLDKTYDDTIAEEIAANGSSSGVRYIPGVPSSTTPNASPEELAEEIEVSEDIRKFWGPGYSPEMYIELEERRQFWMAQLPPDFKPDIGWNALLRQVCGLEVDINHDRANGVSSEKNINSLNQLLGGMNIKPAQKKSDSDTELDKMPLGVGIDKWERFRPLPETPKKYHDESGLIRNILTWFWGHGSKMMGIKNRYSQMYDEAMERYRVKRPDLDEEDDESFLDEVFGRAGIETDTHKGSDDET